jgi:hypothetical protein
VTLHLIRGGLRFKSKGAPMALETQTYTAADLLKMPDDGWCYELVRGELRKKSSSGWTPVRKWLW